MKNFPWCESYPFEDVRYHYDSTTYDESLGIRRCYICGAQGDHAANFPQMQLHGVVMNDNLTREDVKMFAEMRYMNLPVMQDRARLAATVTTVLGEGLRSRMKEESFVPVGNPYRLTWHAFRIVILDSEDEGAESMVPISSENEEKEFGKPNLYVVSLYAMGTHRVDVRNSPSNTLGTAWGLLP